MVFFHMGCRAASERFKFIYIFKLMCAFVTLPQKIGNELASYVLGQACG